MSNYQLFQNDLPSQVLKSFKGDISIDTETLGLNVKRDRLCLIQLRNETDKKNYLIKFEKDLSSKQSKNLKFLLENKSLTKIFHYSRFDMAVLKVENSETQSSEVRCHIETSNGNIIRGCYIGSLDKFKYRRSEGDCD